MSVDVSSPSDDGRVLLLDVAYVEDSVGFRVDFATRRCKACKILAYLDKERNARDHLAGEADQTDLVAAVLLGGHLESRETEN